LPTRLPPLATQIAGGLALLLGGLAVPGCAVRRTTRVQTPQPPPPALEASLAALVGRLNSQSEAIRTLSATVDFEPTAGSVYSGVIKEYHDVRGFILVERPAMIRMIGQAPVIRTNIFDMVSDGKQFRLYIPPKQKFIVGKTALVRPSKNSLENLRPQHILEALLVSGVDLAVEKVFREEAEQDGRRYYVVNVLESSGEGDLTLKRKIWFDRSDLKIARLQSYGPQGTYAEDVAYSDYQDFQGVLYPTRILVNRPVEDYRLSITVLKATLNEPIAPEKFELKKPDSAELVELTAVAGSERPRVEQATERSMTGRVAELCAAQCRAEGARAQ
jgi:outer membrane lipoprotein-sorting protein